MTLALASGSSAQKMNKTIRGRKIDFTHGDLSLIETDDGSHTLYHWGLDETYHSLFGALNESLHVFIRAGLLHNLKKHLSKSIPINILELGWGTGLNSILTMEKAAGYEVAVRYLGLEPYPLSEAIYSRLNYSKFFDNQMKDFFPLIHSLRENIIHQLNPLFSLQKIHSRLLEWSKSSISEYIEKYGRFDLVYFDAFGISKQGEPWREDNFIRLSEMMAEDGILVTYAANRFLKKSLERQRLNVEIISGPPPKREMTRATKN